MRGRSFQSVKVSSGQQRLLRTDMPPPLPRVHSSQDTLRCTLCTRIQKSSSGLTQGCRLYLRLLGKALTLDDGVVQLCVRVGQLPVVHKQLKALCEARLCSVPALRQRAQLSHQRCLDLNRSRSSFLEL